MMALEDRCSPQSAPSPPGIPHSPQSTSSPLILDMSMHSSQHLGMHNGSKTSEEQTLQTQQSSPQLQSQHAVVNSFYASHFARQKAMATEFAAFEQKMSLQVQNRDRFTSESPPNISVIKEEDENDSIISDPDQDHEQKPEAAHQEESPQRPQLPVISFSITNILSDRFGKKKPTVEKKMSNGLFRPFETSRTDSERSAFTRLTPEVLDYSRPPPPPPSIHPSAALMVDRTNFLNCFNPVAYPRIHEEILNHTRKFKQQVHPSHQQPHQQLHLPLHQSPQPLHHQPQFPVSIDVKMPPLGSLCKAVSQIGQNGHTASIGGGLNGGCLASPPPASSVSSVSSTSASPSCRMPSSPQPIPPQSISRDSGMESSDDTRSETGSTKDENGQTLWPAWVYCTRYSDRPSSGPRYRKPKQPKDKAQNDEKRPRTAFSSEQLARLKREFNENRYLTERRRQQLSSELGLNEAQIKIWFQNKRAKIKKSSGTKNPLALQLMAQGLYNHSTVPLTPEEEELEMRMNGQL